MAGHTTRLDLYKPGGGSSGAYGADEAADIDKVNGNMDLIDAAVGAFQCTSTTRPATPFQGQIIYESDTKRTLIWPGGSGPWLQVKPPDQGHSLIKPTGVAGATVVASTLGVVSFSAAAAVNVNGCFTSAYDWYELVFDITTSAAALVNMVLRAAGVDAATAYDTQRSADVGTVNTVVQTLAATSWLLGPQSLIGENAGMLRLFNPALAKGTVGNIQSIFTANPMGATSGIYQGGLLHRTATAYDGFTITPSSGTISGSVRVLGINQG